MELNDVSNLKVGDWIWVEVYARLYPCEKRVQSGYYQVQDGPGRDQKLWVGGPLNGGKSWRTSLFYFEYAKTWRVFEGKPREITY